MHKCLSVLCLTLEVYLGPDQIPRINAGTDWELCPVRNDQKLRISAASTHTVVAVRSFSDYVCLFMCVYPLILGSNEMSMYLGLVLQTNDSLHVELGDRS